MGRPRTGEHDRNVDEVIALILKGEATPEGVVEVVRVNGCAVSIRAARRWIEIAEDELQMRNLARSVGRIRRGAALGAADAASTILKERMHASAA